MLSLHQKLKVARKNIQLTQTAVADHLKVSQQAYNKYENGESLPNPDMLKAIALLYNVSVDWLLGLSASKQVLDVNTFGNIELIPLIDCLHFEDNILKGRLIKYITKVDLDQNYDLGVLNNQLYKKLPKADILLIKKQDFTAIDNTKIYIYTNPHGEIFINTLNYDLKDSENSDDLKIVGIVVGKISSVI